MKKTVLEMVQNILNDMDSEPVNSIEDSEEALQIASVLQDTYFNIISVREIPEHKQLLKIESVSDLNYPTTLKYPVAVKEIESLFYNVSNDVNPTYKEIKYLEPMDFVLRLPQYLTQDTKAVLEIKSGTTLYIWDKKEPTYYTSFDDETIVMDGYNKDIDDTLQASKTRAYGTVYPVFEIADDFTPDLDNTMFPYLLAETKSVCFSLFKNGVNEKIEQASRRQKFHMLDDMYKTKKKPVSKGYGRRK